MSLTAEQVFDKYMRNTKAAGPSIKAGIESSTKSQTGNAIKAKDKMVANHQAAIARGDWEKGLKEAGDETWKKNTIEKGIPKISAGLDASADKIRRKMSQVVDAGNAARSATENMPNNNDTEALAKVAKNMETIKKSWGKT